MTDPSGRSSILPEPRLGDGSRPGARRFPPVWERGAAVLGFLVSLGAAVAYTVDPYGTGGLVFFGVCAALIIAIMLGPTVRGAGPRRVWVVQKMACLCLLSSLFGHAVPLELGPLRFVDLAYFGAYVCLFLWLAMLARLIGLEGRTGTYLDTAALTVGAALAFWITMLAPLAGESELPAALVWTVHPLADVLFIALCVRLAVMQGVVVPSLRWIIAALCLFLVLDVVNSTQVVVHGATEETPAVAAAYILGIYALAVSSWDRSVVHLTRRRGSGRPRYRGWRRTGLIVVTIWPVILATVEPLHGAVDTVVRGFLVTLLLALIFRRLSLVLAALAGAEAESHQRATHDMLTGLLNRAALFEVLTTRLARDHDADRSTAVLFIDCDDFKHVNDTWGHRAGDALLRGIADGLPGVMGRDDVLARHGGDEFVIVGPVSEAAEAVALAERVRRFFDDPLVMMPGRVHGITPSIGIAVTRPGEDVVAEELLGRADVALYEAKQSGRARHVLFDDELARRSRLRSAVGDRLADAIEDRRITIELQPVMGCSDFDTLMGWEALARWRDPELGDIPPDVFIPLAEQHGLICDLGQVVLHRACEELAVLRRRVPADDLIMSVNVSPAQLLQSDFAGEVREVLDAAGLPAEALWIEVTETLLVDKGPAALLTLDELREVGVRVAIDDFGTGYASLSTLLRLPVDCVKLDRSLVARLGSDPDAGRQLGAVMDLVRSLGIDVIVAEGVETQEQVAVLTELGCPAAQGWFYGRAMPLAAVLAAHGAADSGVRSAAGTSITPTTSTTSGIS